MVSHSALVAFLALYGVITAGSFLPQLGKRIDQDGLLPAVKEYAIQVHQKHGFALKRQDAVGSWSLRTTTCPDNTQKCDTSLTSQPACCPKGSFCATYAFKVACCPTSDRCDSTAATFPKCGDSSWSLWTGGRDVFFCCLPGEIGYLTNDNGAACGPDTLKPTGSQVATSVPQAIGGTQHPQQTTGPTGKGPLNTGNTSIIPTSSKNSISSNPSITPIISTVTTDYSPTNPTDTSSSSDSGSNTTSGSSGLPTGAIAGIAVCGVVILILAGVAIFFALKAAKRKGEAKGMEAFQREQRNLPGNNTYQSGMSTPATVVPPMSPAPPPPQPHSQQTQLNPDDAFVVAEKYGEPTRQRPPNAPPPQWAAPTDHLDGPRYEADGTNVFFPGDNHAEMDGYNNQRRY